MYDIGLVKECLDIVVVQTKILIKGATLIIHETPRGFQIFGAILN